jgi:hypothetical protein
MWLGRSGWGLVWALVLESAWVLESESESVLVLVWEWEWSNWSST